MVSSCHDNANREPSSEADLLQSSYPVLKLHNRLPWKYSLQSTWNNTCTYLVDPGPMMIWQQIFAFRGLGRFRKPLAWSYFPGFDPFPSVHVSTLNEEGTEGELKANWMIAYSNILSNPFLLGWLVGGHLETYKTKKDAWSNIVCY